MAVTSTHFQEFNGDANDLESLKDFKEKAKAQNIFLIFFQISIYFFEYFQVFKLFLIWALKVKSLTTDAFYGMGTNMTTGLGHVQEVFKQESMTQEDRDRFGVSTNKVNFGLTMNSTQTKIWL